MPGLRRGYSGTDVAERIGALTYCLYKWVRSAKPSKAESCELTRTRLVNQKLKNRFLPDAG